MQFSEGSRNIIKNEEGKFERAQIWIKELTNIAIRASLIILFSVIAWRIAWSNLSLDLSKFDFSDLLALILSIFAIGMSVAFYFKSTDSSNLFYDNIYNFTQKTSEILGRIEERFGERLKNIDNQIVTQFDKIHIPNKIEEELKIENNKIKEKNEAIQKAIQELVKRTDLKEQEQKEFLERIEKYQQEKDSSQQKIQEIKDLSTNYRVMFRFEHELSKTRMRAIENRLFNLGALSVDLTNDGDKLSSFVIDNKSSLENCQSYLRNHKISSLTTLKYKNPIGA